MPDAYGHSLEDLPSQPAASGSETHVPGLTTQLACHPYLVLCPPSLRESLPYVPDAYDLPSQPAASGSETHVPGAVSE
nr:hypothetical protein [Tanacetum cinerariifolium]